MTRRRKKQNYKRIQTHMHLKRFKCVIWKWKLKFVAFQLVDEMNRGKQGIEEEKEEENLNKEGSRSNFLQLAFLYAVLFVFRREKKYSHSRWETNKTSSLKYCNRLHNWRSLSCSWFERQEWFVAIFVNRE